MTKQQISSLQERPIRAWYGYFNPLVPSDWSIDLCCNVSPDWSEDYEDYWQVKGKGGRLIKFIGTFTQASNFFGLLIKTL